MSVFHSSSCCASSTFCWMASISWEFTCGARKRVSGGKYCGRTLDSFIFRHLMILLPLNLSRLSRLKSPRGERGPRLPPFLPFLLMCLKIKRPTAATVAASVAAGRTGESVEEKEDFLWKSLLNILHS